MSYATSSDQSAMMSQSPSVSNATAIPDLVKIGQIPTNTAIDIETDILDPVVHSDTFCRFQLQNKGILHSNSKIILRLNKNAETGFLPVGVGIHSLLQRVALRVGTKTLCEIDDYNHYAGYKSMFLANEHQKNREMFMSGRRLAHKPYYTEAEGAHHFGDLQDLTTKAQKVGLDNGTQGTTPASASPVTAYTAREWLRTSADYGPELTVSLQDLFPFLTQNQLPLFMMTEPVTIELFFSNSVNERLCLPSGGDATTSFTIDTSATELVADYQYFPGEMMEQYARQNSNLSFTYSDYRLAKRTIDIKAQGSEVSTGQLIINVGGAGRLVTKVFTTLEDDNIKGLSILGKYHSKGLERDYSNASETERFNGSLTSNVKYNDHFLYPVDVKNSAQQFHYLVGAEGMVPFVTREEYNYEGESLPADTYEGHAQSSEDSGLASKFFYQAYRLNRNERINSRGIELYQTWDKIRNSKSSGTNTATLRTYLELIRVAQLKDGVIDTFFA